MICIKTSARFHLDFNDWDKFSHNALVFFAPVGVVALAALAKQIPTDWSYGAIVLYAINLITDLIRKWSEANTATVQVVKTPDAVVTTTTEVINPPVIPVMEQTLPQS